MNRGLHAIVITLLYCMCNCGTDPWATYSHGYTFIRFHPNTCPSIYPTIINQSINQSVNQSINQSIDQSTNLSINQSGRSIFRTFSKSEFFGKFFQCKNRNENLCPESMSRLQKPITQNILSWNRIYPSLPQVVGQFISVEKVLTLMGKMA